VLSIYALREALRIALEEGLEARFDRHCLHAAAVAAGIEALGLSQFARAGCRVPSVVTAVAPPGISPRSVRQELLDTLNVEISTGLDEHADRMWRVGVMGHSAQRANVMLLLGGLEQALRGQGFSPAGSGTAAAAAVYRR
jgi:aspartate aminotransferase-like enzyme